MRHSFIIYVLSLFVAGIVSISCEKDNASRMICTIDTIHATSIDVHFPVSVPKGETGWYMNVVVSENEPMEELNHLNGRQPVEEGSSVQHFKKFGLKPSTAYNGRVLLRKGTEEKWGDMFSFTTPAPKLQNGLVDLGLSVKWSSCNLGASSPTDCGDYYAWGELEPKETYTLENYRFYNGPNLYSKYEPEDIPSTDFGLNNGKLDFEDDAAYVISGGSLRMPELKELQELLSLPYVLVEINGAFGALFCGTEDGYQDNFIFIPEGGRMTESTLFFDRDYHSIHLNASTYYIDTYFNASTIMTICRERDTILIGVGKRWYGVNIRPVENK